MTYHETGSKDVVELNLNTNPTKSVSCCAWFLPPEIIFVSSGPQSCKIITIMMMIIIHLAVKHKFTVQTMRSRRRLNLCKCVSAACALRQKDNFVEPWGGTSSRQITKKPPQKTPQKNRKTKTPLSRWDRQRDQETCDQPDYRNISDQFGSRKPLHSDDTVSSAQPSPI